MIRIIALGECSAEVCYKETKMWETQGDFYCLVDPWSKGAVRIIGDHAHHKRYLSCSVLLLLFLDSWTVDLSNQPVDKGQTDFVF